MNTGLKVALIGGGGLLLYEVYQKYYAAGAAAAGAAGSAGGSGGGGGGAAAGSTAAKTGSGATAGTPGPWDAFAAGLAKAGYTDSSSLSCDQWCFFWNQANPNTPCPDPLQGCIPTCTPPSNPADHTALHAYELCTAAGRGANVTYDVWRAWMTSSGLGTLYRNRRVPVRRLRGTGYVSQDRPMLGWRSYGR